MCCFNFFFLLHQNGTKLGIGFGTCYVNKKSSWTWWHGTEKNSHNEHLKLHW